MTAVFRQIENVPIGQPGQLCCEFVPLAGSCTHGHGKAIVDNAGDLTFNPADVVQIGDHAIADIADSGRQQGEATRRHIDDLAGKLAPIRQHVAAEQVNLHPLKAAAFFGGRNYSFFDRERHLRQPNRVLRVC